MTEYAGSRRQFLELAAQYDTPAFAQRAQTVHEAEGQLFGDCQRQRARLLEMPAMRLARLHALIATRWEQLDPYLVENSTSTYLAECHATWQPGLRTPVAAVESSHQIRRALEELASSFRRFNHHWQHFLASVDTGEVNAARSKYNAYYVIEKSAALQSETLALRGFEELPTLTRADVQQRFPCLIVPKLQRH